MISIKLNPANLAIVQTHLIVKPYVSKDYEHSVKPFRIFYTDDTKIYVPRYFIKGPYGSVKDAEEGPVDQRSITFHGALRPNQLPVANTLLAHIKQYGSCTASLMTGFGKTCIALWIACQLRQKTLVLVHKEFLASQWKERIEQFVPDARVGIIQQNKFETDGDIVICMIQTLVSREYDVSQLKSFKFIIFDEAHHCPCRTFSKALFALRPKYMLGLSATPERQDGLTKVLRWFLGDILTFSVSNEKIRTPTVRVIHAVYANKPTIRLNFRGKVNLPDLINQIVRDKRRNGQIVQCIKKYCQINRQILVLTDRRGHCETLRDALSSYDVGLYLGGMKKEQLDESNTKQIILATYSMCSEGYDCKKLDTLILASPRSNVEQSVGRILRQHNDNPPLILDLVDNLEGVYGQYFKRRSLYTRRGFKIIKD